MRIRVLDRGTRRMGRVALMPAFVVLSLVTVPAAAAGLTDAVDTISDTADDVAGTAEGLLPSPVSSTVDDVGDTVDDVGDTVDDVGDTVDDVGDTTGEVVGTVNDTIDGLTDPGAEGPEGPEETDPDGGGNGEGTPSERSGSNTGSDTNAETSDPSGGTVDPEGAAADQPAEASVTTDVPSYARLATRGALAVLGRLRSLAGPLGIPLLLGATAVAMMFWLSQGSRSLVRVEEPALPPRTYRL